MIFIPMNQPLYWQLQSLRLMSRHVAEQRSQLVIHKADRAQLRQQQQLVWRGNSLRPEGEIRILIEQGVARQHQETQQAQQWGALQKRQQREEQALQQQIEAEKVRQN